jgi:hypothetical protein
MIRRIAVVIALLMGSLVVAPLTPATAAGFTVNSNGDAGDANLANPACATAANVCTLRAAVEQANSSAGSDVITVPGVSIGLTAPLTITSNVTIQGAGARNTILQGVGAHQMLLVNSGIVTVRGLTITGATGGGALAVRQEGGTVTLDRIRVMGNTASGAGGTFGPVYSEGGTMTLRDSEISGNTTTSTLTSAYGGGLSVYSATVIVVNTTLANNTVNGVDWAYGGGIWAGLNSVVSVTSSTIAGNSVAATNRRGAGIYQFTAGTGSVEVQDSIVADPKGQTNCSAGGKLPVFLGKNLIDDASCGVASASRTIGAANLDALANNGGDSNTRIPGAGSPAINAASACASAADQRGQARPVGGTCDLGAAEVGSDREAAVSVSNPAPSGGSDIVVTATARNKGADRSTGTGLVVKVAGAQVLSATVPGGSCTVGGDTATCSVGAVNAGAATDAVLTVRIPSTGTVSVTSVVSGDQPDPVAANDSASTSVTVQGTVAANSACTVVRNGTNKANNLRGTAAGDRINGKGGNDRINGKGGVDCLDGGPGKDRITGGAQADRITAGPGNDRVFAKDGAKDRINCGPGRDRVIADKKDKLIKCEVVRRR